MKRRLAPPPSPIDGLRLASPEVWHPEPLGDRRMPSAALISFVVLGVFAGAVLLALARFFS